MSLIIPPGFAQAVFVHQQLGDAEGQVNTLGIACDDFDPELTPNGLFSIWDNVVTSTMSSDITFAQVLCYVGQDGGPPAVYVSTNTPTTGGQATTMLPSNCATLVRKRTDSAGRRGRGRLYLPGVAKPDVDDLGIIAPAALTQYQNAMDDFLDSIPDVPGVTGAVILHRSEGIGPEPVPTPITRLVVANKIATQRRRLRP